MSLYRNNKPWWRNEARLAIASLKAALRGRPDEVRGNLGMAQNWLDHAIANQPQPKDNPHGDQDPGAGPA